MILQNSPAAPAALGAAKDYVAVALLWGRQCYVFVVGRRSRPTVLVANRRTIASSFVILTCFATTTLSSTPRNYQYYCFHLRQLYV